MVDIKGEAALSNEVTLPQIKANPALQEISLFRRPRISIHPITQQEWDIILQMGRGGG
jgi:predicted RNA-binding protein with PUA-like domain